MCGIGGMLGNPDTAVVQRMNQLQVHRGPDGQNVWSNDHVAFAHARLAIVDVHGSQQPIHGSNEHTLIVNGEIYNHRQLRSKLTNYPFTTSGDSEVILALHEQYLANNHQSPSASDHASWLEQLDGMYAIALWDGLNQQLILARDSLGIKPLVKTEVEGTLLFASEVKALRADERHVPELDEVALAARMVWEYPLDATTLLKGVTQVRPGTVETWELNDEGEAFMSGRATIRRQIVDPETSWNPVTQGPMLLDSFVSSVQQRLMADVPVGIVLSGGLDSSLVAAVAQEAASRAEQPVPECWTVAESEDNPDWKAAELVASHFDLRHHQHILEPDAFERALPNLIWHGEDIDVTVLFFQPLFETMAKKVKVGLCGQGADELHAGYPRYRDLPQHAHLLRQRLQSLPSTVQNSLENGPLTEEEGWFSPHQRPEEQTKDLSTFLQFELDHGQLSNFQLRLVDRHSMAHSLEVRVPFLGAPHLSAANALPMEWRLPPNMEEKAALREAANLTGLPKEIVRRPKMPAGRATSPTMLQTFLDEFSSETEQLVTKYESLSPIFKGQSELALGLGLFESMHLINGGRVKRGGDIHTLLSEVLP
ncbi:MAG: asparagine synthase (glutamine-hydrolyzing) [Candidatus Poseidonia sp.]|uniref:asparagine synthase (glutamine-hydrolyzing) n=1 Tax=Poseidonia sp. TaxID=2666344 RepID=UPI0030BEEFED|nr:asparagine synthase (glutamine-hydrolyzing) [Poseidonia sp.]